MNNILGLIIGIIMMLGGNLMVMAFPWNLPACLFGGIYMGHYGFNIIREWRK